MRLRKRALVSKFFADRGTHLAAMVAYFALLSFVPLVFLSLSLLGLVHRADASDFLVKELSRAFPTQLAQEHPHARPSRPGQRGDARHRRRRRASLVVALALQRARVRVQHRLRRPNRSFLHGQGRRGRRDGRDDHDALRRASSSARSASRSLKRYRAGLRRQQHRRPTSSRSQCRLGRRVRLRARRLPAADERRGHGARRASRRSDGRDRARGVVPGRPVLRPARRRQPGAARAGRTGDPAALAVRDGERDRVRRRAQLVAGRAHGATGRDQRRSTASRSARAARARCELRAFQASPSSATVRSSPSGTKTGS